MCTSSQYINKNAFSSLSYRDVVKERRNKRHTECCARKCMCVKYVVIHMHIAHITFYIHTHSHVSIAFSHIILCMREMRISLYEWFALTASRRQPFVCVYAL